MMKEAMQELIEHLKVKYPSNTFNKLGYAKQSDIDHTAHEYSFTMTTPKGNTKDFMLKCLFIPYNETIYHLEVKQVSQGRKAKKQVKVTKWDIQEGLLKQLKEHFNMK